VGIVAYSPLCRGLLAGAIDPAALPVTDRRSLNPRFTAENFSANKAGCAEPLAQMAGNALCATHGPPRSFHLTLLLLSDQRLHRSATVPRVGPRAGRRRVPHSRHQICFKASRGKHHALPWPRARPCSAHFPAISERVGDRHQAFARGGAAAARERAGPEGQPLPSRCTGLHLQHKIVIFSLNACACKERFSAEVSQYRFASKSCNILYFTTIFTQLTTVHMYTCIHVYMYTCIGRRTQHMTRVSALACDICHFQPPIARA
jgi:hypothetical protein